MSFRVGELYFRARGGVAHERLHVFAHVGGHALDERVAFGVHGGGVERVFGAADS